MGEIEEAMDQVPNLDEDRILRQILGVIGATLRTNYFQRAADGRPKPYLSFKFDPAKVPGLPDPSLSTTLTSVTLSIWFHHTDIGIKFPADPADK